MQSTTRGIGCHALVALSLCVAALGVGACGSKQTKTEAIQQYSEELRQAVSGKVTDEQRKAQMLSIVDRLQALHRRFGQETADFVDSYRKLNVDYEATRSAFDQLFADYRAKRIQARHEALDLHFELAALASADEWRAIGKAETKLYEQVSAARPDEEHK